MLHPSVWGVGILLVCVSRILMHSQDLFLALALSLSLSLSLSLHIQHILAMYRAAADIHQWLCKAFHK